MGIGSGLAGSFGIAPEAQYGQYVPVNRFYEVDRAVLKLNKTTVQSKGLAAGRTVPLASRRVVTSRSASGSFQQDVVNKGMGLLINQLIGGTVVPVKQAATTAYLQTHTLGSSTDNFGKMFSAQSGIPDGAGVVHPYTFLGCKITKLELSCGAEEYLSMAVDVDARDVVETEPLAAPSYTAGTEPFHWDQGTVKIGPMGGVLEVADGIKKVTLAVEQKMATDRYYYGAGGRKAQPIKNDFTGLGGTLDQDFVDKTILADRHMRDEGFALEWAFLGDVIEGANVETFRVTAAACYLDDETPALDGPGVIAAPYKFSILNDGINPPLKIEIMSTDATL